MRQMTALRAVYNAVQEAPRYTGAAIHDMPVDTLRTIAYIKKLGLWRPSLVARG